MRAGKLNKQITILTPVSTARGTDGAPIVSWSTLMSKVWAEVDHKKGKEVYADRNTWEVEETDFIIRYTTKSVTPECRVRYSSEDYDIKAVINVSERDREIKLITILHR